MSVILNRPRKVWGQAKAREVTVGWPGTGSWDQGLLSSVTAHQELSRDWDHPSLCEKKTHCHSTSLERLQTEHEQAGSKIPLNGIKRLLNVLLFSKVTQAGAEIT